MSALLTFLFRAVVSLIGRDIEIQLACGTVSLSMRYHPLHTVMYYSKSSDDLI